MFRHLDLPVVDAETEVGDYTTDEELQNQWGDLHQLEKSLDVLPGRNAYTKICETILSQIEAVNLDKDE